MFHSYLEVKLSFAYLQTKPRNNYTTILLIYIRNITNW